MLYDVTENQRGRKIGMFITSKDLYIINEDRGIANNGRARRVKNWRMGEEESCSDHNTISFDVNLGIDYCVVEFQRNRFITKEANRGYSNRDLSTSLKKHSHVKRN